MAMGRRRRWAYVIAVQTGDFVEGHWLGAEMFWSSGMAAWLSDSNFIAKQETSRTYGAILRQDDPLAYATRYPTRWRAESELIMISVKWPGIMGRAGIKRIPRG